ncbi:MAG: hypothetical protein EAZ89_13515 [Bacteroidetes bacterium]|nr:MAG: hypothetical protein EAZ89_13515 [Bacteroidota bacterium]
MPTFLESYNDAVANFGESELLFVAGNQETQAIALNNLGLSKLSALDSLFDELRSEVQTYVMTSEDVQELKDATDELKNLLANTEYEISQADIAKLHLSVDNAVNAAVANNEAGAEAYIETHKAELQTLRSRADRGVVSNIVIWKLAAIAVWLGVAIWLLILCIRRRRQGLQCNDLITTPLYAALIIALLVVGFCEPPQPPMKQL